VNQLSFSLLHENSQSLISHLKESVQVLGCGLLWKQATSLPAKPVPIYVQRNSRCPVSEEGTRRS